MVHCICLIRIAGYLIIDSNVLKDTSSDGFIAVASSKGHGKEQARIELCFLGHLSGHIVDGKQKDRYQGGRKIALGDIQLS